MAATLAEHVLEFVGKRRELPENEIRAARQEAEASGRSLERVLVEKGLISNVEMLLALASHVNLPPISLARFTPNPELIEMVPIELLRRHNVLPLERTGRLLTVAVADPFDVIGLEEIHNRTQFEIMPVVASEKELTDLVQRYTKEPGQALEEIIRDVSESTVEVGREEKEEISLEEMLESAEDAPVIRIVNSMLIEAMRRHASDIHIEPMEKSLRLRYRVDGVLYETPSPPKSLQAAIISRVKIMANLNIAERRIPQDGRFRIRAMGKEADVRVSIIPTVHGEKVVMRVLDRAALAPNLAALGLDRRAYEDMKYAISQPHGMILVTGPTGSGKTTTLYSALQELNTQDVNIITVEDPVEYQLPGINQVQIHPEVGLTFASGLRSILRQDPDIVMVGEIRDQETATIAVHAALTGHLVLSTLHTNDAAGAVARLLYMGIEAFLLASSLIVTQAQRLYRKLCPACKRERKMPLELMKLHRIDPEYFADAKLYGPVGCPKCFNTGYRGRAAIMEVLRVDDAIRELILRQASANEIRAQAVRNGMVTLRAAALERVKEGVTSLEEALLVTSGE